MSGKSVMIILVVLFICCFLCAGSVVAFFVITGNAAGGVLNLAACEASRGVTTLNVYTVVESAYTLNEEYPTSISVQGAGIAVDGKVVAAEGCARPGRVSDENTTAYCYAVTSTGVAIGYKSGTGDWVNIGSSSTECNEMNLVK